MIDTLVVLDTETSGLDPAAGAALLEVAWVPLVREDGQWGYAEGAAQSALVEHAGPIPPEARAVHHISPEDVAPGGAALPREVVLHSLLAAEDPSVCYAAHSARFDKAFLPELGAPWTCTLRLAQHLWPEAPAHCNQVLRYWTGAEPPADMLISHWEPCEGGGAVPIPLAPHRALYDAACTAALLLRMLADRSPEDLLELGARPVLQRTCRFGKYRGQPWADVPRDYCRWLMNNSDMVRGDPDLLHTVRHHYDGGR